jgi:hypothetical protein
MMMAILDIRDLQKEETTGIKFDESSDLVSFNKQSIHFVHDKDEDIILCNIEDLDNFIAALYKAKELAERG